MEWLEGSHGVAGGLVVNAHIHMHSKELCGVSGGLFMVSARTCALTCTVVQEHPHSHALQTALWTL